jgi:hypothetical protein
MLGDVSYHRRALGAETPPTNSALPPDVSTTFVEEVIRPVDKQRGWVAVPTFDMRQYVQAQLLTFAAGLVVGLGVGAALGNVLAGKKVPIVGKVLGNTRRSSRIRHNARRQSPRRSSTRKRSRGRPTSKAVNEEILVKMPDGLVRVEIERGVAKVGGRAVGSVYDVGTKFRSIPFSGDVRSFGTLAGAAKHLIRSARSAA